MSNPNSPPSCCSSSNCVMRTSSAVVRSDCRTDRIRNASFNRFSSVCICCNAVAKSAVLPTCTTPISSGLPCTIAPLPAAASVCGLVVDDGDTVNTTLAAAALPSTIACDNASRDLRSPINCHTLPLPYASPSTVLNRSGNHGVLSIGDLPCDPGIRLLCTS